MTQSIAGIERSKRWEKEIALHVCCTFSKSAVFGMPVYPPEPRKTKKRLEEATLANPASEFLDTELRAGTPVLA
jgi:hypothetical protein